MSAYINNSSLAQLGQKVLQGGSAYQSSPAGMPQKPEPYWASQQQQANAQNLQNKNQHTPGRKQPQQQHYYQDWQKNKLRDSSSERGHYGAEMGSMPNLINSQSIDRQEPASAQDVQRDISPNMLTRGRKDMMSTPQLLHNSYEPNFEPRDRSGRSPNVKPAVYNLNTLDIPGAQPKRVNQVTKGLKRRNFFEDNVLENLHLKDKYGRKNFSSVQIQHDYSASGPQQAAAQQRPMPRKNIGTIFIPPLQPNQGMSQARASIEDQQALSITQTSNLMKTNYSRDMKQQDVGGGAIQRQDSHSPQAEKRNQSFKQVGSNFDRLYNKRIDFDRIVASQMSLQDKEDYLEKQMRLQLDRTALPPPDQIRENLHMVDVMRKQGHLPQLGRIHQKGIENVKSYESSSSQFVYSPTVFNDQKDRSSSALGQSMPRELAGRQKIGRYSNSPHQMQHTLNVKRDELLYEFNKAQELNYLKEQVRRMESPEALQSVQTEGAQTENSPRRRENPQTQDYQAYDLSKQKHLHGSNIAKRVPDISAIDPRSYPSPRGTQPRQF